MDETLLREVVAFHRGERLDELTYRALAEVAPEAALRDLLEGIARTEARHADFWERVLASRGGRPETVRPGRLRIGLLRLLMRLASPSFVLSVVEMGEAAAYERYYDFLQRADLPPDEAEQLRRIVEDELEHEEAFHQQGGGMHNLRDFVLGMNDGLVEILGSVSGLAAAFPGRLGLVALSGLVVGLAGALSMAIGAFVSVRSQRQVDAAARRRLQILFAVSPQRTQQELERRLVDLGLPAEEAERLAATVQIDERTTGALLGGPGRDDEWRSAAFTGLAYLLGTSFPLLPYVLTETPRAALVGSVLASGAALALVGVAVALVSGISLRRKTTELVAAGLGAAAVAYGFGRLLQWTVGVDVGP